MGILGLTACAPSPVISSSFPSQTPLLADATAVLLTAAASWRNESTPFTTAIADQLLYYARFTSRQDPLNSRSGLSDGLVEPTTSESVEATMGILLPALEEHYLTALENSQVNVARLWASILVSARSAYTLANEGLRGNELAPELGDFIPWEAPIDGNEIVKELSDNLYLLRKLTTAAIGLGGGGIDALLRSILIQVDGELDILTLAGVSHDDPLPSGLPVTDRQSLATSIPETLARYGSTNREYWIRSALVKESLLGDGIEAAARWDVFVRRLGGRSPYWPGWQQ